MGEIFDSRVTTPADLAGLVKTLRDQHKWSQATLAELARLNERTIQRVENAEPSTLDTRRALANAFGFKDLDIFERPLPLPNAEKLKAYKEELEKNTVAIQLARVHDGRTLRANVERTSAYVMEELGDHAPAAREAFAELADYLHDYRDIADEYTATQRIGVDAALYALLATISKQDCVVGVGLRRVRLRTKNEAPNVDPLDLEILYLMLAHEAAFPANIRVPKHAEFKFR